MSDSGFISFVSCFSFVSKRLESQRSTATWSHSENMPQNWREFSAPRIMEKSVRYEQHLAETQYRSAKLKVTAS